MKNTRSICDVCYAEIPAVADPFSDDMVPYLYKTCPVHGLQRGKLEHDREFYEKFNSYDRNNHYPVLIINVTDRCNIKCKHCFYPISNQWDMALDDFKAIVNHWQRHFNVFILSGGDPTCWEYYFEAAAWAKTEGIMLSQLTNGVKFAETEFWEKCEDYKYPGILCAEMSIHPTNISSEQVRVKQLEVLAKLKEEGRKLSCIMMNIDTDFRTSVLLDQVMEEIVDFMSEWHDVTKTFRIRPICFDAWGSTTKSQGWVLSDLTKSLYRTGKRKGIDFDYSFNKDIDNIYNNNFKMSSTDIDVVTVCAANVHNLDIGYLNRGPFMLANDGNPYSVPHALIINEGIDKGWYRGRRIDQTC